MNLSLWTLAQLLLVVGIVVCWMLKAAEVLGRKIIDSDRFARVLEELPLSGVRTLVEGGRHSYVGSIWAALLTAPSRRDFEVEVEEARRAARATLFRGARAFRVLATLSSFCGFVGAAWALGWVHSESSGIRGLDPTRLTREGMNMALQSIALGVAGSTLALSGHTFFSSRAKRLAGECDRAVDRALSWVERRGSEWAFASED